MPSNDKRYTLLRQWELLKALPSYQENATGKAAKDLMYELQAAGYAVDLRTVQRDLQELSGIFAIEANEKGRPFGWRWARGAHAGMPGLSVAEAVALTLVEDHLRQLLPASLMNSLTGLFKQAEDRLGALHGENPAADWPPKVKSVSASQPMLPPVVDEAIQAELSRALLEGHQVRVTYRPGTHAEDKEYVLHPLGLVLRGSVLYLVATAFAYRDVRTYALHRFQQVERLVDPVVVPKGFDLDQELAKGMAHFGNWGAPISIELACHPDLAFHLRETPLSGDQQYVELEGGGARVTASVGNTWQLRWWLLSQGAKVKVLGPDWLVTELAEELREAAGQYDQPKGKVRSSRSK